MQNQLTKDIKKFLVYLKNEKRYPDTTINSYERDLNNYYGYIEAKKINYIEINKDQIREYLKYLDDLKLSKNSISRLLSTLRHFYSFLIINNKLTKNQFKLIKNPKKDKKLPNFLQSDEFQKIIDSIDLTTPLGIRNRLIIELLYATGLRVSELTSIKLNDINKINKEIRVNGKGSKERIVFFGDYALKFLELYLTESRGELLSKQKSDFLLINNKGGNLTSRGIEKIIDDIILGLDKNKYKNALETCEKYNSAEATVTSLKRKKDVISPSKLYSLSKLQNVLGKKYKISIPKI